MKRIPILLLFVLFSWSATGQDYATIYIEGDLNTPFYVKVEGQMQERLAQNYFIIPNLDAGYTNFEILFQQNIYPPQTFLLAIPKSGNRGFALKKVNDRQFALYDLQQKRYIVAGNKEENDWLEESSKTEAAITSITEEIIPSQKDLPKFEGKGSKTDSEITKQADESGKSDEPVFIGDIELNNPKQRSKISAEEADRKVPVKSKKQVEKIAPDELPAYRLAEDGQLIKNSKDDLIRSDLPETPNTDCPEAMDNNRFEELAIQFLEFENDDDKIKFLKKKKSNLCFSTEQVRILAKNVTAQSGRLDLVKSLYIQTSDQENYGQLESLFNTDFLKKRFKQIVKPQ